jgi:hypothetical protein
VENEIADQEDISDEDFDEAVDTEVNIRINDLCVKPLHEVTKDDLYSCVAVSSTWRPRGYRNADLTNS